MNGKSLIESLKGANSEEEVERLISEGWLVQDEDGELSLSQSAIHEITTYSYREGYKSGLREISMAALAEFDIPAARFAFQHRIKLIFSKS